MRVVFVFRKSELALDPSQLFDKKVEGPLDGKAVTGIIEHALKYLGGWIVYRNAFGEASFINLNRVDRINIVE